MYITREKMREIQRRHNATVIVDEDILEALSFTLDLLEEEAEALKAAEPYATEVIGRLMEAAHQIRMIQGEIDDDDYAEGED